MHHVIQAALVAIAAASEVISSSIEGAEGADGPEDETAAQGIANTILQLLLHLSSTSSSLGQCAARIQLVELEVMQTLAPALMHHLAATGGQAQVRLCHARTKACALHAHHALPLLGDDSAQLTPCTSDVF